MNHTIRKTSVQLAALILSLGAASATHAQEAADNEIIPPKAIYKPDPVHPEYLYEHGVEGEATVIVSINRLGEVGNPVVENATEEEFGLAGMLAASEWIFEPASKGGVPIPVKIRIPFEFHISFEHKLNVELGHEIFKELEFPVIPSFELDETPLPLFVPVFTEFYPKELHNSGQAAAVSVEFIIDPEGQVINPRVTSVSANGFEKAAIRAVSHMVYKPVLVDGKPVYVSLILPIQLKED